MLKVSAIVAALGLGLLLLSLVPQPAPALAPATVTVAPASSADPAYGKALFGAKGCVQCHRHAAIAESGRIPVGPNLTNYRPDPAFLRRWLNDPSAVRTDATMPTLGLTDDEITALIAFLSANTSQ